jgi:pimeloyl-ACP methyl ester carboxylesterase
MNKNIILFLVALIIISFGLGTLTGYGKLIPDSLLINLGLKQSTNQNIYTDSENNFQILIHENNLDEIINLRSNLINYIWKETSLSNSKLPSYIEKNIADQNYDNLQNLKQIDKYLISMEYGVNSTSYLFLPQESNNKLIVYHQGHKGDFYNGKNTIEFFLNNGYSVLAFSMPLLGNNNQPTIDTEFGKVKLISHNYFPLIESPEFSPMKFYFEPIVQSLNYVEENFNFDNFYMMGISGGGWTTTVYSAIDERILQSFSIAGSVPISLRISERDLGDYEQTLPNFYKIGNYLELYLLASIGENRKHVQIFNKNDPCCFSGDVRGIYDIKIKSILQELGKGHFEIYLDDTHFEHKISEYSLNIIESEINKTQ